MPDAHRSYDLPPDQAPHSFWRGVHQTLQQDTVGGALLVVATALALVLANTGASEFYLGIRDFTFGPEALHLNLSVGAWAADGLLAIFFFVVGLELKEEFVAGKLRNPKTAALPIAAAVGGVAVPALIYVLVNLSAGPDALQGWAIPAATDIAFAVAVIAVVGKFLPPALRTFLLTLAVVDDLIAISIIAIFYTDHIEFLPLALAAVPLAVFAVLVQRGVRAWWVLIPLGLCTWALIHASGIHATVAGVLLGFMVPVFSTKRARVQVGTTAEGRPVYEGLAAHFADRWSVVSTAVAVPIFAFFSAGVVIGGISGLVESFQDTDRARHHRRARPRQADRHPGDDLPRHPPARHSGSTRRSVGSTSSAWLSSRVSGSPSPCSSASSSFGVGSESDDHVKVGVLAGSLIAAAIGAAILAGRNRAYRPAVTAGSSTPSAGGSPD